MESVSDSRTICSKGWAKRSSLKHLGLNLMFLINLSSPSRVACRNNGINFPYAINEAMITNSYMKYARRIIFLCHRCYIMIYKSKKKFVI